MSLLNFLAEDFARVDDSTLNRACCIDGHRIYISGATGFFGVHLLALLDALWKRGARFEVTVLSRSPAAFLSRHFWAESLPWLTVLEGNACHPWPVSGEHDLLLHAATDTHAGAHTDLFNVFEEIVAGGRQMLAAAERAGTKRLLIIGSGAQYGVISKAGSSSLDGVPDNANFGCDPTRASSAYGEAKRVVELLAALHASRHGLEVINTRCFAFVGPTLPFDGHFAIGNFIGDALAGRDLVLTSDGQAIRSYLYASDLALWLLISLLHAPAGARMNIGSDEAVKIIDLAEKVRDQLAPSAKIQIGTANTNEFRPCYLPRIDMAKSIGLRVWTSLELGVRRTAQWANQSQYA